MQWFIQAAMNLKKWVSLILTIASGLILLGLLWWHRPLEPMAFAITIVALLLGSAVTYYLLSFKPSTSPAMEPSDAKERMGLLLPLDTLFIFNTFHNIAALTVVDADRARTTLENLAELIRLVNEIRRHGQAILAQEIRCAELYLAIEQARLGERLQIDKEIAAECRETVVPSFFLLPLMEHAILHSVEMSEQPVRISLRAYYAQKSVMIEVSNSAAMGIDGQAIADVKANTALDRLHSILQQHYGNRYRLQIANLSPSGSMIRLQLPL